MVFYLLYVCSCIAGVIPLSIGQWLFYSLFSLVFYVFPKRIIIEQNYKKIFPGYSSKKIRYIARRSFANYGKFCFEFLSHSTYLGNKYIKRIYDVNAKATLTLLNNEPNGVIIISSHLGNWEIAGDFVLQCVHTKKIYALVDGLNGGYGRFVQWSRKKRGIYVLDAKRDIRKLYRVLKEGHIVCIVFDRPLPEGGVAIPIGETTMHVPEGILKIRETTHASIMFGIAQRLPFHTFQVTTGPVMSSDAFKQDSQAAFIEALKPWRTLVEKCPEQWHMFRPI